MASTLAPCLQWRNGTEEKPGHLLHWGESARGPADSPNQHYCIIIAFLSLLLFLAFSNFWLEVSFSKRVFLILGYCSSLGHTSRVTHFSWIILTFFYSHVPSSILESLISPLWRIPVCFSFAYVKTPWGIICRIKKTCFVTKAYTVLSVWGNISLLAEDFFFLFNNWF